MQSGNVARGNADRTSDINLFVVIEDDRNAALREYDPVIFR